MSLTKSDTRYIPQKVVNLAYELGVHAECVEADFHGSCSACVSIFHVALDTFYGKADNANDALMMILSDIMEDKDNDSK